MALVKTTLEQAILAAFKAQAGKKDNPDGALQDLAGKLAAAIDSYIKSGTVNTVVTGACPAGPVTGKGTGTIS